MKNNIKFDCPYCYVNMEFVAPGSIVNYEFFELWHCPCCDENILFYLNKNKDGEVVFTGKYEKFENV